MVRILVALNSIGIESLHVCFSYNHGHFRIICMLLQVLTALSFLLFSRENVDIAIVEVSYGTSTTALYDFSSFVPVAVQLI
jgi:folylpolyglutamate synthase/dihydropteroate synthase